MPESGSPLKKNPLEVVIALVIIGAVLAALLERLRRLGYFDGFLNRLIEAFLDWLEPYLPFLYIVAFVLSLILLGGILYARARTAEIRKEERDELYPEGSSPDELIIPGLTDTLPDFEHNPRWRAVEGLVDAQDENSWRQAIIDADIMLGEMLQNMGYQGEGIGEMLKQIERSDFATLDMAWEAHKARNAIAHEGSAYKISQREARRIIDLYRQVFAEFNYI